MKRTALALFSSLIIFAAFAVPSANGQTASTAPESREKPTDASLEAKVDALFKPWSGMDTPGAAVAVVKDGLVVYRKGFGSANLEYGVPITPSTVFHVASVSKQFTAMAVTMLEAEGKLSADDDIRKWLPDLPDFGTPITIRHLLHHIGGMRDQWELLMLSGWSLENVITQDHIMTLLRRQRELNFAPGSRYLYCNSGFTILSEIAARASGVPFTDWTRDHIFRPLGMISTHFHLDPREIVRDRAYSYEGDAKSGFQQALLNYANVGATSLFTTVEDMANWLRNFDEKRVGGAAVLDRMLTKGRLNDGTEIPYGRGLALDEYRGLKTIGHGGADAGFRSSVFYVPSERFGVAVFSNLGSFSPGDLARRIADIYLADKLAPAPAPAAAAPAAVPATAAVAAKAKAVPATGIVIPAKDLASFTGTYWMEPMKVVRKIVLEKDRLVYIQPGDIKSEMVPFAKTGFKLKDVPVEVTVEFSEKAGSRFSVMTVRRPGQPASIGKWSEPFAPDAAALKEYEGRYESPELRAGFDLAVRPGGLTLRSLTGDEVPLQPAIKDVFTLMGQAMGEFVRGEGGAITAIKVSTGRALNVRFDRLK